MSNSILNKELCFQLYIASKEIIKQYKPYLKKYDLTYTSFITLLALEEGMTVNELGEELYLDSGTLSPLLKKLEQKGYLVKKRSSSDERIVKLFLTEDGKRLKIKLPAISMEVGQELAKQSEEINYNSLITQLTQLNSIMKSMKQEE
ncbi:MarR family winged helix-turn-helix transcriptional regulator [Lactococcus garvieae]|uniref:Organic hydroperoxide resistance transcriptional regulator n=1 Tax=Lactococcus garvieae DCC43 TaxID=1231377 RepID=K2PWU5_9LACT|nr:MarR family transcriptional regulator [Lactococcus garvieae]EKF51916.1 Organic hydroperoxide resistance transcriptional regulator [Lactococcus garvieae DCC43]QPS71170.1 MarR family transcriptional regulator [Lactococcus garvieae]